LRQQRAEFLRRRPPAAFLAEVDARRPRSVWATLRATWSGRPLVLAGTAAASCAPLVRDEPGWTSRPSGGPRRASPSRAPPPSSWPCTSVAAEGRRFLSRATRPFAPATWCGSWSRCPRWYAFLANLDDRGRFTAIIRVALARAWPSPRSQAGPSRSIILDRFVGTEIVVFLFSDAPLEEEVVRDRLLEAFDRSNRQLASLDTADLEAVAAAVLIQKR